VDTAQRVLDILKRTEDGDTLHPRDLQLVEIAANGHLAPKDEAAFARLYDKVVSGAYVSPFTAPYWGIPNLTVDRVGYVYWKGQRIEHYTPGWCWTEEARTCAEKLAHDCRTLEARGVPVTAASLFALYGEQGA